MEDRENKGHPTTPSRARLISDVPDPAAIPVSSTGSLSPQNTGSLSAANEELLSGTGSIPLVASAGAAAARSAQEAAGDGDASFSTAAAPAAPRYVRKRAPHRSQGTLDDLSEDNAPATTYTHDSNISVGGSTPLSGMAYRRSRSNISKVKSGSRYGQYLEIPKGRRTLFASRERARRRRSVLALLAVSALLVFAAMALWSLMQRVLG